MSEKTRGLEGEAVGLAQHFYRAPFYLVVGIGILAVGAYRALSGEMQPAIGEWLPWLVFMLIGSLMTYLAVRTLVMRIRAGSKSGLVVDATLTGVERPDAADARRLGFGWVVTYTYVDPAGREHEGESNWMSRAEADAWQRRGRAKVRIHPGSPDVSVWLGEP